MVEEAEREELLASQSQHDEGDPTHKKKKKDESDDEEDLKAPKKKKSKTDEEGKKKKTSDLPTTLTGCENKLKKVEEQIMKAKLKIVEKNDLRSVALGTSKLNYLDPRITISWAKKYGVPLERVFQRTLRDKFAWAMDVDENYVF